MSKRKVETKPGLLPDYWRQLDVFDPQNFNIPVHIIGVGATGSWIAVVLAKMGVRNITVWDFDEVEIHNLPNQIFGLEEVGMLKVEAVKKILKRDCGIDVVAKAEKVDGTQPLEGVVFVCTDTMSSRREIWERALKLRMDVKLVVETRLAAELGLIYTVRPMSFADIKGYEATFYTDEEAEESACTYRSISTMVAVIAGFAGHKLVKLAQGLDIKSVVKLAEKVDHASEEMICINPVITTACGFDE